MLLEYTRGMDYMQVTVTDVEEKNKRIINVLCRKNNVLSLKNSVSVCDRKFFLQREAEHRRS